MPKEITKDEISKILPRTLEVTVKRSGDVVKYKLRTKKTLFTVKAKLDDVEEVEGIIKSAGKSLTVTELD